MCPIGAVKPIGVERGEDALAPNLALLAKERKHVGTVLLHEYGEGGVVPHLHQLVLLVRCHRDERWKRVVGNGVVVGVGQDLNASLVVLPVKSKLKWNTCNE